MLLTLICCLFFAGAIRLLIHARKNWDDSVFGWFIFVAFAIWFLLNTIFLFTSPAETRADIMEFEAVRETVAQQRVDTLSSYERVTLTQTIVAQNKWLAKEKFWAKSLWLNWYYDKAILDVKPIQ